MKFKVGDKVKLDESADIDRPDDIGTVTEVWEDSLGHEWVRVKWVSGGDGPWCIAPDHRGQHLILA